jgi:L-tyrosine isonitrile synthase
MRPVARGSVARDAARGSVAHEILRLVFDRRRASEPCARCLATAQGPCAGCARPHLARVGRCVVEGAPVHFVLPAFPAKSPSARKVLGPRADMAEEIALRNLQALCDEIATVHAPGARITICSDGHVFSDVVGVSDADVASYASDLRSIIERLNLRALDTFSLADVFPDGGFGERRALLLASFADALELVRARTHETPSGRALYDGIHRFLFEDAVHLTTASRNRVRRECGERAYAVIQRSRAWGAAVGAAFPGAVRLSIHPQPPGGAKIGIRLVGDGDGWLTPWHAVALELPGGFRLVHRADAEAMGALLVERDGQPSHFRLEQPLASDVHPRQEVA